MFPMTRTRSGVKARPGRMAPGLGPNKLWKSMDRMSASITSTLGAKANFMRNCAASTRSNSMAMSRRACRESKDVSTPRPGPISRTVPWEASPSAFTMRVAAEGSVNKCCPSFGLGIRMLRAAAAYGALTHGPIAIYTFQYNPRICRAQEECRPAARDNNSLSHDYFTEGCLHAYRFCRLRVRAFFQDGWFGGRG